MSIAARITQDDVKRILKGATAAGMEVGRIRVARDGTIDIFRRGEDAPESDNPWDDLLPAPAA